MLQVPSIVVFRTLASRVLLIAKRQELKPTVIVPTLQSINFNQVVSATAGIEQTADSTVGVVIRITEVAVAVSATASL